jgi:hypothetical protein
MNGVRIPRIVFALTALVVVVGCAHREPSLYLWENFPRQQYEALSRDGGSAEEQIQQMEAHAEKARAGNAALPPGFLAHLGMLHLSVGSADKARELWGAEKSAFPESAPYMDQLLKRLDPTAKTESPA